MADGRTVFVAQLSPRATTSVDTPTPPGPSQSPSAPEDGGTSAPAAPERHRGASGRTDLSALQRLALLADTGAALNNALDLGEGLRSVGRLLT
ncbi:PAS domain S-box protein, partial [Streptomyces sp. TRM76130]|nr:PAS domain S-box protein [Streptomyces sp. TRM76130]